MNFRKLIVVLAAAAATFAVSTLVVARPPAGEPALASQAESAPTMAPLSRGCAVVPASPPPCATP